MRCLLIKKSLIHQFILNRENRMELWVHTRTRLYLRTRVCVCAVMFGGHRRHAVRPGPT